jgi:Zn-finger nucleic acid-binding protein
VTLRRESNGKVHLTECPACGVFLDTGSINTAAHFRREHTPEDFGLTPLGEIDGSVSRTKTELWSPRLRADGGDHR